MTSGDSVLRTRDGARATVVGTAEHIVTLRCPHGTEHNVPAADWEVVESDIPPMPSNTGCLCDS